MNTAKELRRARDRNEPVSYYDEFTDSELQKADALYIFYDKSFDMIRYLVEKRHQTSRLAVEKLLEYEHMETAAYLYNNGSIPVRINLHNYEQVKFLHDKGYKFTEDQVETSLDAYPKFNQALIIKFLCDLDNKYVEQYKHLLATAFESEYELIFTDESLEYLLDNYWNDNYLIHLPKLCKWNMNKSLIVYARHTNMHDHLQDIARASVDTIKYWKSRLSVEAKDFLPALFEEDDDDELLIKLKSFCSSIPNVIDILRPLMSKWIENHYTNSLMWIINTYHICPQGSSLTETCQYILSMCIEWFCESTGRCSDKKQIKFGMEIADSLDCFPLTEFKDKYKDGNVDNEEDIIQDLLDIIERTEYQ